MPPDPVTRSGESDGTHWLSETLRAIHAEAVPADAAEHRYQQWLRLPVLFHV